MTIDAAALVAMVLKSPGVEELVDAIAGDENRRVPATAIAEAGIILAARGSSLAEVELQILVDRLHLTVVPFTNEHWREAIRTYEKGMKKQDVERPRFGRCLSAAVAAKLGSRLLAP